MVTHRNRLTPSGNGIPIPANTEVVREYRPRNREWLGRPVVLRFINRPRRSETRSTIMRFAGTTSYPAMFRGSSRPLLGVQESKPKRGRLSVSKGTREACPSRVIAQPGRFTPSQVSPTRRTSGGAVVVVRGRESRSHGEGRQDVSFWATEGFTNREGSR